MTSFYIEKLKSRSLMKLQLRIALLWDGVRMALSSRRKFHDDHVGWKTPIAPDLVQAFFHEEHRLVDMSQYDPALQAKNPLRRHESSAFQDDIYPLS